MDKNLTVSVRGLMVTGLVLVLMMTALAVAYLVGAGTGDAAGAAGQSGQPEQTPAPAGARRTLTMAGVGTTTAVPDQLAFEVSVLLLRDDLDVALNDTNELMKDVLATLTDGGVAKKDIQTTGLSMNPAYDYPDGGGRVFLGYRVSERVSVTVDLAEGGEVVSAAIATGQELGEVITLTEVSPGGDRDEYAQSLRDLSYKAAAASAVPIRAGETDLVARVQVVWELQ